MSGAKYKTGPSSGAEPPPGGVPSKDGPSKDGPSNNGAAAKDGRAAARELALLQKAQAGAIASAYGQIVVLYQDRLFNALLRMVGEAEEARELTQETFTSAGWKRSMGSAARRRRTRGSFALE